MRTRSNFYPFNSSTTIPRRSNRRRIQNIVEPAFRAIENIVPMAAMEELLQAPTEGYEEAIVILEILVENFEIKTKLLQTSQLDFTWDDLVNKFVNQFFPPSKTTHLKNEMSRFTQRFEETFSEAWDHFKEFLRACPHHGFSELTQIDTFYNGLTEQDQDSRNAAAGGNLLNKTTRKTLQIIEINQRFVIRENQPSTSGTLPSNTIPNPKGEMKAVTTRNGLAYEGPSIPTGSPLEKVDEQNTEKILDKEQSNSSRSTAQVQPLVAPISIPEPNVSRTKIKPTIPYPSSFSDALLLMPKFALTIKSLLVNKDKLFELAKGWRTDPHSDDLELADRSITRPKGVAEDVFVNVRKFYFPTDFIVVEFEAYPRGPLILGRSFLRTGRALIDVYGEEITLRVNDESITFNLNQTMRYSLTYDDTSMNRVDVVDVACEEFVQDVLDFQYNPKSSIPTLVSDDSISERDSSKVPIVKSSSSTLTPFGESDFFLEEIEDFMNDDSIPIGIENFVYDPKGDILFLEKIVK
uniref:Reverse transcriptase domain-containing protein n=1 Tax=Tanacetum cinerariifolium TaxID=118510 RepID=A0A699HJ61_TANCI|nr:reverse transcriptase domain-containing protein [Tanacetum cinerariifolium]